MRRLDWLIPLLGRLWIAAALTLIVACGDSSDAPTSPPADSPGTGDTGGTGGTDGTDGTGGTDEGNTDTGDPTGGTGDPTGGTGDGAPADPTLPGPMDLALEGFTQPIGTRPGFTGSPYTVDSFPLDQMQSVLPRDAIPAVTDPDMVRRDQLEYLKESDLVFGVVINGDARAYPHNIGWWHEIVNDVVGGHPVSVTFCPLTGTGLVFDARGADGSRMTLGVSGLLYNTNLVMFDRADDTLYPQLYAAGVRGDGTGQALDLLPVVETTWAAWKRMYPETLVVASGSYRQSRYTEYPYGDYRSNDTNFLFQLRPTLSSNDNPSARQIPAKDRVLGVRVDGAARAYPFGRLGAETVVNDEIGGQALAVVYDADSRMVIPYSRVVDGQTLTFEVVAGTGFPFSLRDQETGSLWDITGRAVEGELAGAQLAQLPAHNSMWFAWVTFWPGTDVWQG